MLSFMAVGRALIPMTYEENRVKYVYRWHLPSVAGKAVDVELLSEVLKTLELTVATFICAPYLSSNPFLTEIYIGARQCRRLQ